MAEKYFSRREAEELLPMIGGCLGEALEQKKKMDQLDEQLSRAAAKIMVLGGSIPPHRELAATRTEREQSLSELQKALVQIQETGCVVKDLDMGLVDFPSLRDGEEVYLCWKLGEERIAFYHGIEEGFAGRKPLDDAPGDADDEPPPAVQ
jgi:hypothetical protein